MPRRDLGDEGLPVQAQHENQGDLFEHRLQVVAQQDVEGLVEARHSYGDSWKAEGGFSAWFNIKRKIDRLCTLVGRPPWTINRSRAVPPGDNLHVERYDLFGHIEADVYEGGEKTLDALRDLRRYCLLAEAEMLERLGRLPMSRDNKAADERDHPFPEADLQDRLTAVLEDADFEALCLRFPAGWIVSVQTDARYAQDVLIARRRREEIGENLQD